MMNATVSIFIPAYNAAETLPSVIDRIEPDLWKSVNRVYMINDGSTDRTTEVMGEIAIKNSSCVPVSQKVNLGYGATVKHGLALCRNDGCAFAVCLHADGQYPPESIKLFVATMRRDGVDLMQGSRIASGTALSGGMPLYKYAAGRLLTALENRIFRLAMTDYHSGFLVYGRRTLDTVPFDRLGGGFDFDLEVIATARLAGLRIGELPIPTRYAGEKSYLNPMVYGMRVLRVLIRYHTGRYALGTL